MCKPPGPLKGRNIDMENDFIIGQVSWITQVKRNYEFDSTLCI